MKIGEYLTSNREDMFGTPVDFGNGSDAYKVITSHSLSRYGLNSFDYSMPFARHNKLIFWVAPETGIVMFEDEQHRRWKLTAMDSDGDGTDNLTDTDDDNDGVLDADDALPLDPNSSTDNNNDGRG